MPKLGIELHKKPDGYWDVFNNLKKELDMICKKEGKFPSSKTLKKYKKSYLSFPIMKFGGFVEVAERIGQKSNKKSNHYWNDFNNVKNELSKICTKTGKFRSGKYLRKIGRQDLEAAIRIHGGPHQVSKKAGYLSIEKPKKYWNNYQNIKNEFLEIYKKLGKVPTENYLRKIGKSSLAHALSINDNRYKITKELGLSLYKKPKGFWSKEDNLEKELRFIREKTGKIPSYSFLRKIKRHDLLNAINKQGT